jgi:hypothetical protein
MLQFIAVLTGSPRLKPAVIMQVILTIKGSFAAAKSATPVRGSKPLARLAGAEHPKDLHIAGGFVGSGVVGHSIQRSVAAVAR